MRYTTNITAEETIIELSERGNVFFSAKVTDNGVVEDVFIRDGEAEEIIFDADFDSVEQYLEWSSDLIERLKAIETEMKKLIKKKPTTKKDSKGESKKK
jgi:hypothetical protein